MFNRFDILEAWYLWLADNHEGQGSEKYARLSKLQGYFKPRPNLYFDNLSENAQQIYLDLLCDEYPELVELPIHNDWGLGGGMWVRVDVGSTTFFLRTCSFEDCNEAIMDWCAEHMIGAFVGVGEHEYREAAEALTYDPDEIMDRIHHGEFDDKEVSECIQSAEADMYMVTHTTLDSWDYDQGMPGLVAYEIYLREIDDAAWCAALAQRVEEEEDDLV